MPFPIELQVGRGRGASAQLHRQLREAILEGRLATGFRLPATRDLARMLGVARATVVLAYEMLLAEGYTRSRQGDGTFVQAIRRVAAPAPSNSAREVFEAPSKPRFDLRLGSPDVAEFPFHIWRRLEARSWRALSGRLQGAADPAGLISLRRAIVGHISYARAVSCAADDIVVTAGAQQGFDLLARTLIDGPGTIVAVEDPSYTPARAAFSQAGGRIVGVPVDDEGIIVSRIPTAARIILVTPSHQFPLGVTMSAARRMALLEHARRHEAYIVEDDYDCEYRYDGRPLDALQTLAPGRVCYVGTFSKTMFPALRLGFLVVPDALKERILRLRQIADGWGAPGPQHALAEFIGGGHLHRHVRRMQRIYAARRTALIDGLRERLDGRAAILPSQAGLHFSFRILGSADWDQILQRAAAKDTAFERCSRYSLSIEASDCCAIGFGLLGERDANGAVDRLAAILE